MQIGEKCFWQHYFGPINSSLACALKMQYKYVSENLLSISLASMPVLLVHASQEGPEGYWGGRPPRRRAASAGAGSRAGGATGKHGLPPGFQPVIEPLSGIAGLD